MVFLDKMSDILDEELETHDIYLSAYLLVSGCVLVRQRAQGARKYFIFKNPAGSIKDLQVAYYSNQTSVKPHQYAQQIIAFKQMCFAIIF